MTDITLEAVARIIDPSAWQFRDGFQSEYKSVADSHVEPSLAKARAILAAFQPAPSVDLERAMTALKEARGTVGTYYAKSSPAQQQALAKWALFHGDPILKSAIALASRRGGRTQDEFEASINAELVGLIRETAARILGGNCTFADDDLKAIEARLTTTARERDRLRKALKPFADMASGTSEFWSGERRAASLRFEELRVHHFRDAAAALGMPTTKEAAAKEPSHGE